ncbi:hypothetical protein CASFOL_012489 [Castilleja foliolosa]|uniref:Uncharacterized protein n=1 Tax=Castilleja foliolosa TaxID=1961234 RepID=A0ABD3DKQ2_9LAMI
MRFYRVDKIPLSFESVDQYLDSYSYPLLEETRAELASAIEVVYKLPFAEIASFEKRNTFLFDVKGNHWENVQSDRGSEAYRIVPGDIVLVSNMKPETAFNVRHAGYVFFLACVTDTVENKSGVFEIRTSQEIEVADVEKKSFYVVCLMNLNRNERIWNALGMHRNLKIIESVLIKNDLGQEKCEFCPLKCKRELEENFGSSLLSKLNESQLKAVLSSLSKIECTHKSSVDLIWGPPGTGKTTTLSTLLHILSKMNVRTVVCGPTDAAITELASRVIQLVRSSFKTESEDSLLPCSLGDMLIYANKDNLKVGSHIGDIILNDRVERLEKCLAPLLGLKHCVSAMIGFLEGCVNHEITKGKSLLEFARDRFSSLETPLRECMLTFVTHLPRSFVYEQSLQSMDQLMCHLDSIKISLFEDNSMTSEKLECIFGSAPFVDTSSFMCIKSECVAILRSLQAYLDKLDLPVGANRSSIAEFCFQKASLIFCTISSSYKLHSVNMEPITVLLIDKAARVKECETIIPLNILDVRHAVLVGDEKQLPATVNSELSEGAGFGRSLFERLSLLGHFKHLLNVQYKMHPSISQFPNLNFYRNQILDAPCVQSQSYVKRYLEGRMFGPYSFINIPGGKEELDDVRQSIKNNVEVATVVKLVRKLFKD